MSPLQLRCVHPSVQTHLMARETSCQGRLLREQELLVREQELPPELVVVDMAVVEDAMVVTGVQVRRCCDPDRERMGGREGGYTDKQ